MNEKLEAALSYASRGWYVFPVKAKQKIPATRHGHKDATVDPDRIIKCWGEHPDLNIGVALSASSLVAVDVDAYKPDCKFDEFMRGIEMPTTLVVLSRLRSGLPTHLCGLSFECQGAFST
jgi:hypothetical protein